MKAIQTRYKGYRFRSRLEARYAVLFDALGIRWDYEPEGFEHEGLRYLPDFWLHIPGKSGWGYWVEIKPNEITFDEARKLQSVAAATGHHGWFFVGAPGNGVAFEARWPGRDTGSIFWSAPIRMCAPKASPEDVDRAVDAARSARFEFGESGARA